MKKRINESMLNSIVKESVKNVLRENSLGNNRSQIQNALHDYREKITAIMAEIVNDPLFNNKECHNIYEAMLDYLGNAIQKIKGYDAQQYLKWTIYRDNKIKKNI